MILTPSQDLNIDVYPDADFTGLYDFEDSIDLVCVCSQMGLVITDCPVLWKSSLSLQMDTAATTMEAEVVALGSCCKGLFPIMNMDNSFPGELIWCGVFH